MELHSSQLIPAGVRSEGQPQPVRTVIHDRPAASRASLNTKAAHRRLPGGHLLLVGDEQLFEVVGGTRFLQLVLDVPDQLILGLQRRPSR